MTDEELAERAFRAVIRKKGRWERDRKSEPVILKSPNWSARYAFYCVGRRWKEAEAIIATDAESAFGYALNIRGPFPEAEKAIARDADYAYRYATYILQDRFPQGEKSIAKNPEASARYASDIIGGRWKKGEKAIMEESQWMLHYARKSLKARLPEPMHTKMHMLSFGDDAFAKKYLCIKKFHASPKTRKTKKQD